MIRKQRTPTQTRKRRFNGRERFDLDSILTPTAFQLEIRKEIFRSDRRLGNREFGLVRFDLSPSELEPGESAGRVVSTISSRLRISDSIGWYQGRLALLLPETDKDSTLQLADAVAQDLHMVGLSVSAEASIYPYDDELISLADELQEELNSRHGFGSDDRHGGSGSTGVFAEEAQFRLDAPHRIDQPSSDSLTLAVSACGKIQDPQLAGTRDWRSEECSGRVKQTTHRFLPVVPTPWWKRAIDVLGASAGLVVLSPVLITAGLAIKFSSPGPVLFRQLREGKDGESFGILKFRTMEVDAESKQEGLRQHNEQDGPAFKLTDDPRVTLVGKYLRKSCVDELPQLINVLKGEMSLVGPRPLPIHESRACKAWQRARLTVLPGLTCFWQARGGREVSFAEWMKMDLDYIEQRSLWVDLRLIVETACIALLHRGSV